MPSKPLPARQLLLLHLLDIVGDPLSESDFHALLFLYSQGQAPEALYDFVPAAQGPFSFNAELDLHKLADGGLISVREGHLEITNEGRRASGKASDASLADFAGHHKALKGEDLMAEVLRRHPYYGIRCERADQVLGGDRKALGHIRTARPTAPGPAIQTIGYEGLSLEAYLNTILQAGGTLLCDVRGNPFSRKFGFAKKTLARGCEAVGIRYEHLPELGIASDQRQGIESPDDYAALFEEYARSQLPKQTGSLDRIKAWVDEGQSVVLTCYEHLPEHCHRHCVADALERRFGPDFAPRHL